MAEFEMVKQRHWLNGHESDEFEQTSGDKDGQGSLVCCRSWAEGLDMTQQLKNNNRKTLR